MENDSGVGTIYHGTWNERRMFSFSLRTTIVREFTSPTLHTACALGDAPLGEGAGPFERCGVELQRCSQVRKEIGQTVVPGVEMKLMFDLLRL